MYETGQKSNLKSYTNKILTKKTDFMVTILVIEKILQHSLTALFFVVMIPGIGTPDIGPYFNFENNIMAIFNSLYCIFFGISLIEIKRRKERGIHLIISLAALDIVLEVIFHGLGYITISVLVSTILIIVLVKTTGRKESDKEKIL
jgi:hypothetical protein